MALQQVLRRAFAPLEGHALGVLLWGSTTKGTQTDRSDVDVCLVAGPGRDPMDVLRRAWRDVDPHGLDLDIRVFEELPRFLQGAVLEHHLVVMTEDEPTLYEYLYPYRRLWADEAARNRLAPEDARRMLGGHA